ncbi:GNAT family N-acetyltransferase [Nonomuraea sp. NN258]|uniref:GNAT family N-acetyltransferase n=1 Tax=Nonomuraea antri TaxID=2730852 RepID=UPI00156876B2|nr:GNAT family N-acetyltransferase [Nonomuraea antri]NRQ38631.1 GNAT family N-acetyltransferase [Nonomuraea antri]
MNTNSRPTADDAALIHELVAAYDTAIIGAPDMTLDDVADQLVEPGFDLDQDGWLTYDADGRLIAWSWACRNGDSDLVDVEVIVRPGVEGLESELWRTVLQRARELGAEAGHENVTVDIGIYRADQAKQDFAKAQGFAPGTSFHRMRVDHDGQVEPPAPLTGLTLHTGDTDEVRREAHRVHQEGFADHFGFVPADYDHWYERRQAQSTHDWNQTVVARIDGRPAAVLIANNQFVPDENCGYVATLATLPEFRGRGLGRFLLRHAFVSDAARGRKGTILHVDFNNTTPALGLYESAGMRQVMAFDVWRRKL